MREFSCIAGLYLYPHRISELSHGGRTLKVAARNWSDTATFEVEARRISGSSHGQRHVREYYPVIFGPLLIQLAQLRRGVLSIRTQDVNAEHIVFIRPRPPT